MKEKNRTKKDLDNETNNWWLRSSSRDGILYISCVYGGGGVYDRISSYDGGVALFFII